MMKLYLCGCNSLHFGFRSLDDDVVTQMFAIFNNRKTVWNMFLSTIKHGIIVEYDFWDLKR
jgi:hypothetical protein